VSGGGGPVKHAERAFGARFLPRKHSGKTAYSTVDGAADATRRRI
jgi:hypothetical protein